MVSLLYNIVTVSCNTAGSYANKACYSGVQKGRYMAINADTPIAIHPQVSALAELSTQQMGGLTPLLAIAFTTSATASTITLTFPASHNNAGYALVEETPSVSVAASKEGAVPSQVFIYIFLLLF
jgi:hypothetical protein